MAGIMMILFIYLAVMYFANNGRNHYYVVLDKDQKSFRILKKAWYLSFLDIYVGDKYYDRETAEAVRKQYEDR